MMPDNADTEMVCFHCGEPVEDNPIGDGVWHARSLGDRAFDLDRDHVAIWDDDGSYAADMQHNDGPVE